MSKEKEQYDSKKRLPTREGKIGAKEDIQKGYQPTSRTENRAGEPISPPKKP